MIDKYEQAVEARRQKSDALMQRADTLMSEITALNNEMSNLPLEKRQAIESRIFNLQQQLAALEE